MSKDLDMAEKIARLRLKVIRLKRTVEYLNEQQRGLVSENYRMMMDAQGQQSLQRDVDRLTAELASARVQVGQITETAQKLAEELGEERTARVLVGDVPPGMTLRCPNRVGPGDVQCERDSGHDGRHAVTPVGGGTVVEW